LCRSSSTSRLILINGIVPFIVLFGWRLLMGDTRLAPVPRFDLSTTAVLKFAISFGLVEASNDTLEKVLQPGLSAPEVTPKNLLAYEENRAFVYALVNLTGAKPAHHRPDAPRMTRRLIFLKPSTFVLDDEIETGSSPGNAEWLLHSRVQPSVPGRFASMVDEDHELICETLLPEKAAKQAKRQLSAGYTLQVTPKNPSARTRFLHVLHIRRRGERSQVAPTQWLTDAKGLHLKIQVPKQTYQLTLPSAQVGAGELEVTKSDSTSLLNRRFFPSGVLPNGREGVRLLELWDGSYRGGKRPFWDAGQPSGELRRAVDQGIIRPGRAVDLGCGSGTDSIYLASKGFDVTGIDIAPTALSQGREKADRAGVKVRWLLANVLSLPDLTPFDFIFDRGCYHEVRFVNAPAYVETIRRLSLAGRTRFLLLAGNPNEIPMQYAPPQVAEEDIRSDFSSLFKFEWLRETRFETSNPAARGPLAWSVMMRRKDQR